MLRFVKRVIRDKQKYSLPFQISVESYDESRFSHYPLPWEMVESIKNLLVKS